MMLEAQGKLSLLMILVLLLAISTAGSGMTRRERGLWNVNDRSAAAPRPTALVIDHHHHHDPTEQILPMKQELEAAATSSGMLMMRPVHVGELSAAAAADTTVLRTPDVRNLALVDLELNNPRAPMKRTPDNIPQPGSIPREELERLVEQAAAAQAAAAARSSSSSSHNDDKNESLIIAVATLVPLAVLVASFLVLRKTQQSRSELATSHLSPDFAAPDMSFPASAGGVLHTHRHGGMIGFGGARGRGAVLSPSTLDTIPEEQEDLVGGGKSPFRFRGIV